MWDQKHQRNILRNLCSSPLSNISNVSAASGFAAMASEIDGDTTGADVSMLVLSPTSVSLNADSILTDATEEYAVPEQNQSIPIAGAVDQPSTSGISQSNASGGRKITSDCNSLPSTAASTSASAIASSSAANTDAIMEVSSMMDGL